MFFERCRIWQKGKTKIKNCVIWLFPFIIITCQTMMQVSEKKCGTIRAYLEILKSFFEHVQKNKEKTYRDSPFEITSIPSFP